MYIHMYDVHLELHNFKSVSISLSTYIYMYVYIYIILAWGQMS